MASHEARSQVSADQARNRVSVRQLSSFVRYLESAPCVLDYDTFDHEN